MAFSFRMIEKLFEYWIQSVMILIIALTMCVCVLYGALFVVALMLLLLLVLQSCGRVLCVRLLLSLECGHKKQQAFILLYFMLILYIFFFNGIYWVLCVVYYYLSPLWTKFIEALIFCMWLCVCWWAMLMWMQWRHPNLTEEEKNVYDNRATAVGSFTFIGRQLISI